VWRKLKELRLYLLVVIVAYILILDGASILAPLRTNLQNVVFDQYQRWRPREYNVEQPVRIVDIDDESIRRVGRWPWPREKMAEMVDKLTKAEVATISIAVLFSEKDQPTDNAQCVSHVFGFASNGGCEDGDVVFARSIADRPVVLGSVFIPTKNAAPSQIPVKAGFAIAGDAPAPYLEHFSGVLAPLPILMDNASGIGFMNWSPDNDRVIRRVPLLVYVNGQLQPSLDMEALRVAQGASTYIVKSTNASGETAFGGSLGVTAIKVGDISVPTQPATDVRVYFAKSDQRRSIPAWKIFDQGADLSDLAGKIVIVGASASLLSDVVATPLNPSTPGVEVHAQLVEQILSGVALLRPDWAPGAEVLAGAALTLVLVVAAPIVPMYWSALLGALAAGALVLASWLAFTRHGVLIDPVIPSFSSGLVFLAGVMTLYSQKRHQVNEIRSAFGRFVSPAVVARLAEHPENLQLGGLQRQLTLMFCDLRSFTTLSEGFTAVALTKFLNEYLTPMTNTVLKEMGTVDKYMGDAIMAFWNAPLDDPDHAVHAVRTALEMRGTLVKLNAEWAKLIGQPGQLSREVKFGIGLNTGECCVGNLGSTLRFDYSAIGDEVNIASRLEGASKVFGVDIVASAATRDETPGFAWLEIDRVLLKNKTRPTAVYTLVGDEDYARSAAFETLAQKHDEMLLAYRAGKFDAAVRQAAIAGALAPNETKGLYDLYYKERFEELAAAEIEPGWEPVLALETK
jgi:adenylate cyclase